MARRKDVPLTLSPGKWAHLNEAFHQARRRLGYDEPTERDITRDLRNGDLIGATREILRGQDRTTVRPASFWNDHRVVASRSYGGATIAPQLPRGTYVFIRRDRLDKRYPRELPAAAQSRSTTSNRRVVHEPRRKPGPKTKDDWPIHVAAELIQRVRAGEKMPTPAKMCQWCEDNWGWQPDIRQMQGLFKVLLP